MEAGGNDLTAATINCTKKANIRLTINGYENYRKLFNPLET